MECAPKDVFLELHHDTFETVRKDLGLDAPGAMKKAVDELEEWVEMQHHFKKKDFSRHYLETQILCTKGSVERAKQKLERACYLKTTLPQYFGDYDIKKDFIEFEGSIYHIILPKLTKQNHRVMLFKAFGSEFRNDIVLQATRKIFMMLEYLRAHDYNNGIVIVVDYLDCPNLWSIVTKTGIFELREVANIFIECYGSRLKGIHYLTTSLIINILTAMAKRVVSAKLGRRFYVHKDLDSLFEVVERDIFPVEYGGQERSLESISDEWSELLSTNEFRNYRREMNKATIDETLRKKPTRIASHRKGLRTHATYERVRQDVDVCDRNHTVFTYISIRFCMEPPGHGFKRTHRKGPSVYDDVRTEPIARQGIVTCCERLGNIDL